MANDLSYRIGCTCGWAGQRGDLRAAEPFDRACPRCCKQVGLYDITLPGDDAGADDHAAKRTAALRNAAALRAAIADITPRHAALPRISGTSLGKGWLASHDTHRCAAEDLVNHIRRQHGARVRVGVADTSRLRLHGVTATCTSGLSNLVGAWLAKAQRRLDDLERGLRG